MTFIRDDIIINLHHAILKSVSLAKFVTTQEAHNRSAHCSGLLTRQ